MVQVGARSELSGVSGAVDPGHEFAVGAACGGEFFLAFFQLQPQVDELLFEEDDPSLEFLDVGGRAQPRGAPAWIFHRGDGFVPLIAIPSF